MVETLLTFFGLTFLGAAAVILTAVAALVAKLVWEILSL